MMSLMIPRLLLNLIPALLLTAGAVMYLKKTRRFEGWLLLAGSLLILLMPLLSTGLTIVMARHSTPYIVGRFSLLLGILSMLGHLVFAAGFLVAVFHWPERKA